MSRELLLKKLMGTSFADVKDDARAALQARMRDLRCRDTVAVVCAAWSDVVEAERTLHATLTTDPALLDTDGETRRLLLLLLEALDAAETENVQIMRLVERAQSLRGPGRRRLNTLLEDGAKLSEALQML